MTSTCRNCDKSPRLGHICVVTAYSQVFDADKRQQTDNKTAGYAATALHLNVTPRAGTELQPARHITVTMDE